MPYGLIMSLEDAIRILTAVPERKSGKDIEVRYLRRPKWFFWLFIDDLGYLRTHHDLQIYRLSTHEIVAKDWSTGDKDTIKGMYNNLRHPYFD